MPKQPKITEEMLREQGLDTPLAFLMRVMNDKEKSLALRMEAAKNAAPFIHRKMPIEIETSGDLKLIGPFVPSLHQLAELHPEVIEADFYQITDETNTPTPITITPDVDDEWDDL